MKKLVLSILFVMQVLIVFGQQNPGVTGIVVDSKTQRPLQSVVVSIQNTTLTKITSSEGAFLFENVPSGEYLLQVRTEGYATQLLPFEVSLNQMVDLGVIVMEEDITSEQQLSLITITESDLGDDNSGSESTAGLLQATRDAFLQASAFNFGQARFRVRGLDNEYGATMINGVMMNKLYDGRPQWGNWGGLNDATRNQEFTNGSGPSDYTFGGILGTQEINTRASIYRPGSRVSFSGTNTNYSWRTMATHASGMNKNGWAYVISGGRRWAQEGFFEGTDYAANSLFASVEKKINDNHSLNFTSIYAQNSRGKNSPNTREVNDLAGTQYNSYWGWQNGKKRNSRDKDLEEPILMLSHYWKVNTKTKLNTNVSYQFGKIGNSRLDFNNVTNPDPTYYRNLPSYYLNLHSENIDGDFVWTPDFDEAGNARANFLANRQINWDQMYRSNSLPITDENGMEIGRAPTESVYVLYEDRTDDKLITVNTIMNSQIADNIIMNASVSYRNLKSNNFQNLLDLLGGLYFSDVDPFFAGSQSQPDLNNPNRLVGEGDKYGYNYNILATSLDAFTQFKFTYNKVDFYLAQSYSRSEYQREGLYQNGIYPETSFGKSRKVEFDNFGFKGGLTYKITGRHLIDVNAIYMTKAPTVRNTFPNARLNNQITAGLESETIYGGDISYVIRAPRVKARATAFYNKILDATEVSFFFAEGLGIVDELGNLNSGNGNAFVAEVVTGLDKKNMGLEFGLEYQVTQTIKATAVAAYGQYTYDSNPNVALNVDNVRRTVNYGSALMKDYRQPGTPQQAYSLGLEYRDPKFWWIGANVNFMTDNYLDISTVMRTNNFFNNDQIPIDNQPVAGVDEELARQYLKQEKFDEIYLVNLVGGKSWRVSNKNRNTVGFFASINNVLDLNYISGGFEQGRNANYTQVQQDYASGTRAFGPKYFYGFGRNYFVNFYYNF
ncbi:carboxypeptidase-like regulatory domain-containing protein [Flavobacterium orientale]|uniref:TonB-dependent receptor n=1 Tax=Flavobacterium orientale TaxID=1756020 RepID=A0A916XXC3_9FLAO|nr:carboxypeptidase regulatory-like domain-containing protein [Flavobacterium orientale]GGD17134.1 TonB-dependent receptor [Flavobacterium orientale]